MTGPCRRFFYRQYQITFTPGGRDTLHATVSDGWYATSVTWSCAGGPLSPFWVVRWIHNAILDLGFVANQEGRNQ